MKKKNPAKFKTVKYAVKFSCSQSLNNDADKFEDAGIKSFKEGRVNEFTYRFDMARCLRIAAQWLSSEA